MKKEQESNKQNKVIGILAGSFHSDFAKKFVSDICSRFEQEEVEIHLYCGMDSSRYLPQYCAHKEWVDPQYYSVYGYSNFDRIDVMIISFDTINDSQNLLDIHEFLSKLPKVPKIVVGEKAEGEPETVSIVMDDYSGMRKCVDHLIEQHDCRRIGFLSGSPKIVNGLHRLTAYRDSMAAHGLDVTDEMICYGNFTSDCMEQAAALIGQAPDAIVTANDEMAVGVYNEMKKRELVPGTDILVAGFDDIPIAKVMDPPLTTMRQDLDHLADCVYEQAMELLQGQTKSRIIELPIQLVPRCSCGCQKTYEKLPKDKYDARGSLLFSEYNALKRTHNRDIENGIFLRSLLMYPVTMKTFFEQLGRQLQFLGIEHSAVSLLEEPVSLKGEERMFVPEEQRLVMALWPGRVYAYNMWNADILYRDHAKENASSRRHIASNQQGLFCTFLLSYEDIQYGMWMVKLDLSDMMFYYTLSLSLTSAIRYLYLALDQQNVRKKLEEQNQILDFSSSHDPLTGLYNRAGFMKRLLITTHEKPKETVYVVLLADLDHLKQINDTYGHEDGDFAILKTAEVLKTVMMENGAVGRFGGDEFTCFFEKTEELDGEKAVRLIKSLCEKFNEKNEKPYYVNISVGYTECMGTEITDLKGILKQADAKLYENKKSRRSNVIRV